MTTSNSSYQLPFQLGGTEAGGDRQTDTQTPPPVTHSSSATASSTTISPFHSPVPEATSMSSMASESTSATSTGQQAVLTGAPSSSVSGGGYTVTMAMPAPPAAPSSSSSSFLPLAPPSTLGPGGAAAPSLHPYQHHLRGPESAFMMTSSTAGTTFESSSSSTAAAVSVPRVISGLSATSSEENLYARGTAHITTASAAGTLSVTTEVSSAHRVIAAPMGVGTSAASATSHSASSTKKSKANAKSGGGVENSGNGIGDNNTGTTGTGTGVRRQKRLERNRESARLSRRRRKQYLEVLEERVTELSNEMDTLRRAHVAVAVSTIQQKRNEQLQQQQAAAAAVHPGQQHQMIIPYNNNTSSSLLFHTSPELILASVFRSQQLKSFALPPSYKFILWLTLQNDTYFRGGRAASERLSAARIGERMLQSGNDRVTPIQSMWPLVCNEVCLSYEQEEKARNFQRTLLQTPESWVDRHTAFSCDKAMDTAQEALESTAARVAQREQRGATTLLSAHQRANLLAYTSRNRHFIAHKIAEKVNPSTCCAALYDERFQTSPEQHVAGNLYTLNYRLRKVLEKTGISAPLVTGLAKKKLAVRPCFETLGARSGEGKEDGNNGRGLSREASFASTGSLKRNCSEISMDTSHMDAASGDESQRQAIPPISPENAQATAMPLIEQVLGHLKEIIPPPPVPTAVMSSSFQSMPTMTMSSPVYSSTPSLTQQHQQQKQVASPPMTYAPAPVQQYQQQQQYVLPAPTPVASMSLQLQQLQPFVQPDQQPTPQQQHQLQMQHYQVQQPRQAQQHQVLLPMPVQHLQYAAPPVEKQQQQQQVQYTSHPGAVYSTSQEVQYAVAPVQQQEQQQVHFSLESQHSVAAYAAASAQIPNPLEDGGGGPPQTKHQRVSSFLPAHLNVVPEEMWPDNDDKEFLMSLADEDWAIGAGVEMEY